jgi:glycosyltransferase involved in cell wall biosynthesis
MQKFSIVIICKNEEEIIGRCLQSLQGITDDIVVLDNGSTDATKEIIKKNNVRFIEESWEGFGKTKKRVTQLAKYDWVLNIDADEVPDEELKKNLLSIPLNNDEEVYAIRFKNFLGKKHLRFGEWGNDKHLRLFNRTKINWDDAIVHENLVLPQGVKIKTMKGFILHYTMKNIAEYAGKMIKYALLNASKYAEQGKKSSWIKIYFAPAFNFVKYYFFKLGFLDGWEGFICAKMTSFYTFIKYSRLKELNNEMKKIDHCKSEI